MGRLSKLGDNLWEATVVLEALHQWHFKERLDRLFFFSNNIPHPSWWLLIEGRFVWKKKKKMFVSKIRNITKGGVWISSGVFWGGGVGGWERGWEIQSVDPLLLTWKGHRLYTDDLGPANDNPWNSLSKAHCRLLYPGLLCGGRNSCSYLPLVRSQMTLDIK